MWYVYSMLLCFSMYEWFVCMCGCVCVCVCVCVLCIIGFTRLVVLTLARLVVEYLYMQCKGTCVLVCVLVMRDIV